MSRSNGPGAPPNGWPADNRPNDAVDPYQDPYYAQQPVRQPPPHGQPQAHPQGQPAPARGARIQQQPAPSRVPQNGLPPNLSQAQQPPVYGQPYPSAPQHTSQQAYGQYGQPAAPPQAPQQYAPPPQYAPQSYAPPASQPQAYAPQPVPRTQPPVRTVPPAQNYQPDPQDQRADPRFAAYPSSYDAPPTGRPTQPAPSAYPPAYTPAPTPLAYVPETTQRPTQPPQQRAPQHAQPPQLQPSSYDKWQVSPQAQPAPGHQAPALAAPPQLDPHGYDLGNYLPASTPDQRTQRPTAPPAAWPQHAESDARQQNPGSSFPPQFPAGLQPSAQALQPVQDDHYEDGEDDEDYEEPPRKTRYGLIAASLIAAIAMGGGLAYAYKMYVAPRGQIAAAPVVKNSSGPVKVKPVDPGGTKFANADSKMMEQLAGSSDTNADGGPKVVRTMTIERDGTVQNAAPPQPPAIQQPSPAALPRAASVPGMMIEGLTPSPPRPPQQPQPAAVAAVVTPVVPAQQPPRAAPKIISNTPPPAAFPNQAPPAQADAAPAAAAPAAPVKKVPPKKVAAADPVAAPSAVGGPKNATGFVAVLASVPASGTSRNNAMQQFADLQQRFIGVLGSKSPDIVEAKLPNGVYHRLVVGPPASRDSATSVCTQLKASGYTSDCWVTAF